MSRRKTVVGAVVIFTVTLLLASIFLGTLASLLLFSAGYIVARSTDGFVKHFDTPHHWTCLACETTGMTIRFRTNKIEALEAMKDDHILTFHSA